MQLTEDFLHYIWQCRLLKGLHFVCKDGQGLQIIEQGLHNTNAGPDFSMAKLKIGRQIWVGNIEIHLKASDWLLHNHQSDQFYDSVILHAVYEDDQEICRTDGTVIPVLVLKGLIPEELLQQYQQLFTGKEPFPCAKLINTVEKAQCFTMLERMADERLEQKSAELHSRMERSKYDWNGILYYLLLKAFGFKVNSVPFEILADALQLKILLLHRDNALQVNALLFGMAGFLEDSFRDEYPRQLQAEYRFLQKKYNLKEGKQALWKFMRIRPQNFPVLRIAQVAALFCNGVSIFTNILQCEDLSAIKKLFSFSAIHPYWKNHSYFDHLCKPHPVAIGKHSLDTLIINSVCLFLYCYGNYFKREDYKKRALSLLKALPAEQNNIISAYVQAGLKPYHAFDSQALLQLSNSYCAKKRCLDCLIGNALLCKKKRVSKKLRGLQIIKR